MIAEDYLLIEPDWSYQIRSTREWRTVLLKSLDLSEQRAKLRNRPNRKLDFYVLPMSAAETNYLTRKLYKSSDKVIGVPFWCDQALSTQSISPATGVTFSVDSTDYKNFDIGGPVIVFGSLSNYEVKQIVSITSNLVTVDSSFTKTFASGTRVFPMLQCRLGNQFSGRSITTSVGNALQITVKEAYDPDVNKRLFTTDVYSSYLEWLVFTAQPNYVQGLGRTVEVFPNITEFLSTELAYSFTNEGMMKHTYSYLFDTKEEANEVIGFFDDRSGMFANFWFPTWQDDIVIKQPFSSVSTTLTIEDIEWNDYWSDNDSFGKFLYISLADGTEVIKKIISAPTSTTIQLDSAIGHTVTSVYGIRASFLLMGRFATDDIEVKHYTQEVSEVEITLASLSDVSPSTTT